MGTWKPAIFEEAIIGRRRGPAGRSHFRPIANSAHAQRTKGPHSPDLSAKGSTNPAPRQDSGHLLQDPHRFSGVVGAVERQVNDASPADRSRGQTPKVDALYRKRLRDLGTKARLV